MQFVHAGVRSGEAEHTIDGFVHHSDLSGIRVSWAARDLQSGITEYLVAIGTGQGLSSTQSPKRDIILSNIICVANALF